MTKKCADRKLERQYSVVVKLSPMEDISRRPWSMANSFMIPLLVEDLGGKEAIVLRLKAMSCTPTDLAVWDIFMAMARP